MNRSLHERSQSSSRRGAGPVSEISTFGLGCSAMSGAYGPADRVESIATMHAALDAGINLIDTGDFYGMGHNELLIAEAVRQRSREEYLLSVKFGAQRGPDGSWLGYDASPNGVKSALAYSLNRLNVDYIDIYRPTRLDPDVPIEETIGAIAELVEAGYVRFIGLSEVGPSTIRRAAAVHSISDLQIEYSLISRGIESDIIPTCRELSIGITSYGILSRGLLGGKFTADRTLTPGDSRVRMPRFASANRAHNLLLVGSLRQVAQRLGATVAQVAVAWVLARGDDITPLLGARTREQLKDMLGAAEINLAAEDITDLEKSIPPDAVAGFRYPEEHMNTLDSEHD